MIYKIFWALPTIVVFLAVYNGFVRLQGKVYKGVDVWQYIFVGYISVLLTITLDIDNIWVSIWYRWPLPKVVLFSGDVNFLFFDNMGSWRGQVMLLENIALFVPFGLLLHTITKKKKCLETVLAALLFSITVECIQFTIGRAFDVDDLLMNTIGASIGWILWKHFSKL